MTSLDVPPPPWAYDSNNNELDPELKAAHRVALLGHAEAVDAGLPRLDETSVTDVAEPILLRNLLSAEQIDEILTEASVDGVWPRGDCDRTAQFLPPPCHRHRLAASIHRHAEPSSSVGLCGEIRSVAHHLAWTDEHVVLYMHLNDWFVRTLPDLWCRIRGGMESRPWMEGGVPVLDSGFVGADTQSMSRVRSIELHHYATGGGLVTPGHRDCGSDLTISVLLSDPAEVSGGDFVTYREGVPVAHKMGRGDAILFKSEDLHNISTITSGLRQSLVVELWPS